MTNIQIKHLLAYLGYFSGPFDAFDVPSNVLSHLLHCYFFSFLCRQHFHMSQNGLSYFRPFRSLAGPPQDA